MSAEENKRLVRRYIEEVVNTGDVARIAEFIAPDYVDTHDTSGQSSGLDGARRHVLGVRETYPDLRVTVEQQIAEGDWVATRVMARGTHGGVWLGMRPTGKTVEITGVNIDRVVGGRIVEHGGGGERVRGAVGDRGDPDREHGGRIAVPNHAVQRSSGSRCSPCGR